MKRKIIKITSIITCFILLISPLMACQSGKKKFSKEADLYLKGKYGVSVANVLYYAPAKRTMRDITGLGTISYTGTEYGLFELTNGDRVIVAQLDGIYSDNYELMELFEAWTDKISQEIGADVRYIYIESGEFEMYDTTQEKKFYGTFLERTTTRYNASNVDQFEKDLFQYMSVESVNLAVYEVNPSDERLVELSESLNAYRKKHGFPEVVCEIFDYEPQIIVKTDVKNIYGYSESGGDELSVMFDNEGVVNEQEITVDYSGADIWKNHP